MFQRSDDVQPRCGDCRRLSCEQLRSYYTNIVQTPPTETHILETLTHHIPLFCTKILLQKYKIRWFSQRKRHFCTAKRSTIEWLCANEKCSFSATPEEWRRELAPGMYVWTDNSTATKINILHGMFEECNIPASELVFEFRSDQEGEDEE